MEFEKHRKISEEGRARISESRIGKKWSQEVKDKISASKKGNIFSAEHRSRLSAAGKGRIPWNKGIKGVFKHTDEAKSKIAEAQIGRKRPPEIVERIAAKLRGRTLSEEHRAKLREKRKGRRPGLGRIQSEEERKKHRDASIRLGLKPPSSKGRKHSPESLARMSEAQKKRWKEEDRTGEKSPNWRGGITPRNHVARTSKALIEWRQSVFNRDNWTCQRCGAHGVNLHAHHIKEFAKHLDLRFEVSNGLTMCKPCHLAHHGLTKMFQNGILVNSVPAT